METFIYILIGIVSAVFTYSVGYSVIGVVRGIKTKKNLEDRIFQLQLDLETTNRELHQRMDMDIQSCNNYVDEVQSNLDLVEKDIFSQLDSRLDKLENKLRSDFSDDDIDKLGYDLYQLRDKVDEFIRTYQNQ